MKGKKKKEKRRKRRRKTINDSAACSIFFFLFFFAFVLVFSSGRSRTSYSGYKMNHTLWHILLVCVCEKRDLLNSNKVSCSPSLSPFALITQIKDNELRIHRHKNVRVRGRGENAICFREFIHTLAHHTIFIVERIRDKSLTSSQKKKNPINFFLLSF